MLRKVRPLLPADSQLRRLLRSSRGECNLFCSHCAVPRLPVCLLLPLREQVDSSWATDNDSTNEFLTNIGLSRIVSLDNTIGASAHGRDPFIAHLTITLDAENNTWLKDNPDGGTLHMHTDDGPRESESVELVNRAGYKVDALSTEFHFVIDRSMTTLYVSLRSKPLGGNKNIFGEGHKLHQVLHLSCVCSVTDCDVSAVAHHDRRFKVRDALNHVL